MVESLVSIIIPSYNHAKYINDCLESVLSQSYKNIEIILIDDGSTDQTFEIATSTLANANATLVKQQNMGLIKTINNALRQFVRGEFVVILASDDWLAPESVSKQVAAFNDDKDIGFVFGKALVISDNGKPLFEIPKHSKVQLLTFDNLLLENFVPALSAMCRRSALEAVGLYDLNSKIEDWDMWLRISARYKFRYVNEVLGFYRQHGSQSSKNVAVMLEAERYILEKYKDKPSFGKAYENHLLRGLEGYSKNDKKKAIRISIANWRLFYKKRYLKSIAKLILKW